MSQISKVFDKAGWLSPVVAQAKILMMIMMIFSRRTASKVARIPFKHKFLYKIRLLLKRNLVRQYKFVFNKKVSILLSFWQQKLRSLPWKLYVCQDPSSSELSLFLNGRPIWYRRFLPMTPLLSYWINYPVNGQRSWLIEWRKSC